MAAENPIQKLILAYPRTGGLSLLLIGGLNLYWGFIAPALEVMHKAEKVEFSFLSFMLGGLLIPIGFL